MRFVFMFCSLLVLLPFARGQEAAPLWLRYPAVSPDGRNIAFSYKGDIYRVSVDGGQAVQLTTHPGYDSRPVWSPDGERIAFQSDREGSLDIYVISANGGSPVRITAQSGDEIPCCFDPSGQFVYFTAVNGYSQECGQYPLADGMRQLYRVPIEGGRIVRLTSLPVNDAAINAEGNLFLYHDCKGYEDEWRKHHTSSITRDVWLFDAKQQTTKRLTFFDGEDREPVFTPGGQSFYYLSERSGCFNVWKADLENPSTPIQLTSHDRHPVRSLSVATDGTLCYSYDGEIYTLHEGGDPRKVEIVIRTDQVDAEETITTFSDGIREMAVSPGGKEVAFIYRGDLFVASTEFGTVRSLTNTPWQERQIDFSPDGRSIVYAAEKEGVWNIYSLSLVNKNEKGFTYATRWEEKQLTCSQDLPCFQPHYSPDGRYVAYLENRTTLKVLDLTTGKSVVALDGKYNYSYSDGDQEYAWSPDSRWLVVSYFEHGGWKHPDLGLVPADGSRPPINLTQSAYFDNNPQWVLRGNAILYRTDRHGYRNHGSWGTYSDLYLLFLRSGEWLNWQKSREEREIFGLDTLVDGPFELEELTDRMVRLTWSPSSVGDAYLTPDGRRLYYSASSQDGYDLWVKDFGNQSLRLCLKNGGGRLVPDEKSNRLFILSGGQIRILNLATEQCQALAFKAEFHWRPQKERSYIFEHVWKQMADKLYAPDMNGVDWAYYHDAYRRFLPHINNNYDFSEMVSEMLGELNVSHTGMRYYHRDRDITGHLGVFFDETYDGDGLRIVEILRQGPLDIPGKGIKPGVIIRAVNNRPILQDEDWLPLLNRTVGRRTLLTLYDPVSRKEWNVSVKPMASVDRLLYNRWVARQRAIVDSLSDGRIGYVHVQGMNSSSFRRVFSEALGLERNKEAIVIDTRFNTGGWLHEDLLTLFSGRKYMDISPRGQHVSIEPFNKWSKPSVLLVGEGNYSDAHAFPYGYRTLGLGKIIGMPVPGTMTLVWWEYQQDPSLQFGIPQMGIKANNGQYLEHQQLEPDIRVENNPNLLMRGIDQQLEKAVEVLLQELDSSPK